MNIIHEQSGRYPLTATEVIAENPNTSFPVPFALPDGYEWVTESVPSYNPETQKAVEKVPLKINGSWTQFWDILELTKEELDAKVAQKALIFAKAKADAAKQIYADVDAIYRDTMGDRSAEYAEAEEQALAFKAAGYSGTAPSMVASWMAAKGWTATKAADDIVNTAASWRGAQAQIRSARLLRGEQVKNAADQASLTMTMAQWNGFRNAVRGMLGLS